MKKRGALLMAALLTTMMWGSIDLDNRDHLFDEHRIKHVDLSGPSRITDIPEPVSFFGVERSRSMSANTPIGIYTLAGFIPSQSIQSEFTQPRQDLAMVLVDDLFGMWDARVAIEEIPGLEIRTAVPPSGFLVQGYEKSLQELALLPLVAASHPVPKSLLIHPSIEPTQDLIDVEIMGWNTIAGGRSDDSSPLGFGNLDTLSELGFVDSGIVDNGRRWGSIDYETIVSIVENPAVAWIAPLPQLVLSNDEVRDHTESEDVEAWFSTTLDGSGQRIAVGDSGIDHDHGDFGSRIVSRTSVTPGDSSTADGSGHGTHVACTAVGSGYRSSGQYAGVAPAAEIIFQAMEDDDSGSLYSYGIDNMLTQAYNNGARLHTNSWGSGSDYNTYTTSAEDADNRISTWDQYWNYEGMSVFFSAGNEGSSGISPPATAKNVVAVGAHQNRYGGSPDAMYPYSSEGPTDDGRIKPDVIAPGMYVRSCEAQESGGSNDLGQWYEESSGTSMATPAAAGASILIREYLMEIAQRPAPQASLIKAMLILGAEDVGTPNIPNNVEGWGRIDLSNSLIPESDVGIFVDDRHRLKSGEIDEYSFEVTRAGEPLKIVLAWSDYPGSTSSSDQLRNDLNLEVISPGGTSTYLGNVFSQGKSVTGGQADSVNNVEAVLVEAAGLGLWTVRVSDVYHSGARQYQPYSIALRGVNVNDLTPDPAVDLDSFTLSTPIPQVGETVTIGATIANLGAGSVPSVSISASSPGQPLGVQTISMAPGEAVPLEWQWTPAASGTRQISIEIDPTDQVEESSEQNNLLTIPIEVSEPGIRVETDNPNSLMTIPSGSTTLQITLTNTALFPTNASISASNVVRMSDGAIVPWYSSFSQTEVELNASEQKQLSFALAHPNPPEPGVYRVIITGTDEINDVTSELILKLTVSTFPAVELRVPGGILAVDAFEPSSGSLQLTNEGNGPQTYDLALAAPAGWRATLDNLGTFVDSTHGSTGILTQGASRSIDITLQPPSVVITAGTLMNAQLTISARTTTDSWAVDIPLIVTASDKIRLTPNSDGSDEQVRPDATHKVPIQIVNEGNREITLTPQIISLPGGWSSVSSTQTITIDKSSTSIWDLIIEGNGRAVSGVVKVRLLTQDGNAFLWNRTIDVTSGAQPVVSFSSIVSSDGSSSTNPLGLGALPVNTPFDLSWSIANQGLGTWSPVAELTAQDDSWSTSCSPVGAIQPGSSSKVWCSITIPETQQGGSEAILTLRLEDGGLVAIDTVSLLIRKTSSMEWSYQGIMPIISTGETTTVSLDVENLGNSAINSMILLEAPSGWTHSVMGGDRILSLSPGESRSIDIEITAGTGRGPVVIDLQGGSTIEGSSYEIPLQVRASESGGASLILILIGFVILVAAGGFAAMRLRSTNNVDGELFSKDEIEDRAAAIGWAKAAISVGESEKSVLTQLKSTGWSTKQSKAIIDLSKR